MLFTDTGEYERTIIFSLSFSGEVKKDFKVEDNFGYKFEIFGFVEI